MNTITKLTKIFSLATVLMLALALSGLQNPTQVQAQDGDDKGTVNIPLGSIGLALGEGLRTTLTNLGKGRFNVQIKIIDADGVVVKQEPLTLEAGQMRIVEISHRDMGRSESSVMLRTEVIARPADGKDLWMTSEIIDWASGSTQCPPWTCSSNHNETLVRDNAPMK
jgi:hypothetical protein